MTACNSCASGAWFPAQAQVRLMQALSLTFGITQAKRWISRRKWKSSSTKTPWPTYHNCQPCAKHSQKLRVKCQTVFLLSDCLQKHDIVEGRHIRWLPCICPVPDRPKDRTQNNKLLHFHTCQTFLLCATWIIWYPGGTIPEDWYTSSHCDLSWRFCNPVQSLWNAAGKSVSMLSIFYGYENQWSSVIEILWYQT